MAYEKAVETGVAKNTIDRYFDHQALEDYFDIVHKSYINWQARIDETKKKLAELNQELLDFQNNPPTPEVPSLDKPIEEVQELKDENNNIQQVGSQIVDNQRAISDSASKTNEVLKEQQVLMYHIGEMNKAGTQLTHGLGDEPSA